MPLLSSNTPKTYSFFFNKRSILTTTSRIQHDLTLCYHLMSSWTVLHVYFNPALWLPPHGMLPLWPPLLFSLTGMFFQISKWLVSDVCFYCNTFLVKPFLDALILQHSKTLTSPVFKFPILCVFFPHNLLHLIILCIYYCWLLSGFHQINCKFHKGKNLHLLYHLSYPNNKA